MPINNILFDNAEFTQAHAPARADRLQNLLAEQVNHPIINPYFQEYDLNVVNRYIRQRPLLTNRAGFILLFNRFNAQLRHLLTTHLLRILGEEHRTLNAMEFWDIYRGFNTEQRTEFSRVLVDIDPINLPRHEARIPDDEAEQFRRDRQNIHTPPVERTVDASIHFLLKTYNRDAIPNALLTMTQIHAFLETPQCTTHFTAANIEEIKQGLRFLATPNVADSPHLQSMLKLKQILSLIWMAAKDERQLPEDFPARGNETTFALTRQLSVIEKILYIATTYRNTDGSFRASCIGGARNHIVSALDKAHPDVSIAQTLTALNAYICEAMKRYQKNALLMKINAYKTQNESLAPVRNILDSWSIDDSESPIKTAATQFKLSVKDEIFVFVRENFQSILSADELQTLFDNYEYLGKPTIDEPLLRDTPNVTRSRCSIM